MFTVYTTIWVNSDNGEINATVSDAQLDYEFEGVFDQVDGTNDPYWSLTGPNTYKSDEGEQFDLSNLPGGYFFITFQFYVNMYYSAEDAEGTYNGFTYPSCGDNVADMCEYDDYPSGGGSVFLYEQPTIANISPSTLPLGQNSYITITGYNFGSSPTVNLPPGVTQQGALNGVGSNTVGLTVSVGNVANYSAPVSINAGTLSSDPFYIILQ